MNTFFLKKNCFSRTGLQDPRDRPAYNDCPDRRVCCLPRAPARDDTSSSSGDSDSDGDDPDPNGGGGRPGDIHEQETEEESDHDGDDNPDQNGNVPLREPIQNVPRYERGPASKRLI